jgi:hypothetical protein
MLSQEDSSGTSTETDPELISRLKHSAIENREMRGVFTRTQGMLLQLCKEIPPEFKPTCRAIILLTNQYCTTPSNPRDLMSRQEYRTATKRLKEPILRSSSRTPSIPLRDEGILIEYLKIVISFIYCHSYPSSRNQNVSGFSPTL